MFYLKVKEFLNNVCKEIKYKPARKPIFEELGSHIDEIKYENICQGLSENQAEEIAVEQMGDSKQIGKRLNKIHRPKLDWKLLTLILILVGFRIILYSIHYLNYQGTDFIEWDLKRDIKYTCFGIIFAIVIYFFDYRKSKKWANLMYFTATMILIFQWINWYFNIDGMFSDNMYIINMRLWNICIPLYIIAFAGYMTDYKKEDFWYIIILYTISCVLIYWQSDSITNTIILILAYLTITASKMFQNNKKSLKKVIGMYIAVLFLASISMLVMVNIKIPYLFDNETSEYTYNVYAYETTQKYEEKVLNNLKWIGPADEIENISDLNTSQFKFLYLLGTLGIIPATILLLAIVCMSVRIIKNSKNIKDTYGKYLTIGLGTTYIIQSIIHVLMNLNLWIRSDVNLPFVTEGNLYFLINCFTFAIILSVYRRKDINFEEPKKSKLFTKIENYFFEEC